MAAVKPPAGSELDRRSAKTKRFPEIWKRLNEEYPGAKCALKFSSPHEMLFSTILSAQCTDVMVNKVTSKLFKKYRTLEDYAAADPTEFQKDIYATGFYRQKTKNIQATARKLLEEFDGEVPDTMEELVTLPGVARKTANIVLGNSFGKTEGIAVDTHVKRLSRKLKLTRNEDPNKIERDLMRLVPREDWFRLSYLLIEHGRAVCIARRPKCEDCVLNDICPSSEV